MEMAWRAEGSYPTQGWTLVPEHESGLGDWVESETERVRAWWGDDAPGGESGEALRDMLQGSYLAVREPGTLTTMLHWPLPLPVPSRVRVVLAKGGPVDRGIWEQAGFEVDEYPGARIGPALKCVASRDEDSAGRRSLHLSTAAFVFASSDAGAMVVVEAGSREVFQLTLSRMPVILSTLTIYGPDGKEFQSDPVPGVSRDISDEWENIPNA